MNKVKVKLFKKKNVNKLIKKTLGKLQDVSDKIFEINAKNKDDFYEYIDSLLDKINSIDKIVDILNLNDIYDKLQSIKKYDFSKEINTKQANSLYSEYRKHDLFVKITELMKYYKLSDEVKVQHFGLSIEECNAKLEMYKSIMKQYTSFFGTSISLTQMIDLIISTMKKTKFQNTRGLDVIRKFVGHFENNYQKYYYDYISSNNACGKLITSIFDDMGEAVEQQGSQFDKSLIKQLTEFIDDLLVQHSHIRDKIEPFYKNIRELIENDGDMSKIDMNSFISTMPMPGKTFTTTESFETPDTPDSPETPNFEETKE